MLTQLALFSHPRVLLCGRTHPPSIITGVTHPLLPLSCAPRSCCSIPSARRLRESGTATMPTVWVERSSAAVLFWGTKRGPRFVMSGLDILCWYSLTDCEECGGIELRLRRKTAWWGLAGSSVAGIQLYRDVKSGERRSRSHWWYVSLPPFESLFLGFWLLGGC